MNKLIIVLLLFCSANVFSQEILVRTTEGKDVDLNKILAQSDKDQPTVLIAWSITNCFGPCPQVIQAFIDRYPELNKKYNLRVVSLNVGDEIDERRERTISRGKKDYPNAQIQSVSDVVREFSKEKNWLFECYSDEYGNFSKTANLTVTPTTYLFINGKSELLLEGWVAIENLGELGFDTRVLSSEYDFPAYMVQKILEQMNGYEAYFTEDWLHTLKEFKPAYKRTVVKMADLFEITDAWITGEVQMKATFKDIKGKIHQGKATDFYKSGNVKSVSNYVDNILSGTQTNYYENGKTQWKGIYINGKYDGVWEGFYHNGKPMAEKVWSKGELVRINYFFDKNDQKLLENGSGTYIEYYSDFSVLSKGTYINNVQNGEWTYYYQNGKISEIRNYEDNKLHGVYKKYYDNGNLKVSGNFWEGEYDSVWVYYDEAGIETSSQLWERGLKVR